jgi:hypothetical protein
MIKMLSFFMAVYIVALTLMPCMDHHDHQDSGIRAATSVSLTGHDQDHQDCCSPFCTCSCCHLPFQNSDMLVFGQDISLPEIFNFVYDPVIKSAHYYSIWQPPKA